MAQAKNVTMRTLNAGFGEKLFNVADRQAMSYVVGQWRDMARYVGVCHTSSVANGRASTLDVIPIDWCKMHPVQSHRAAEDFRTQYERPRNVERSRVVAVEE